MTTLKTFLLLELAQRPEILAKVRAEINAVCTDDVPTIAQLENVSARFAAHCAHTRTH